MPDCRTPVVAKVAHSLAQHVVQRVVGRSRSFLARAHSLPVNFDRNVSRWFSLWASPPLARSPPYNRKPRNLEGPGAPAPCRPSEKGSKRVCSSWRRRYLARRSRCLQTPASRAYWQQITASSA
jgi:hypothetical protein